MSTRAYTAQRTRSAGVRRGTVWLAGLLPVLLAVIVFWPSLENSWLLDDHFQVVRNRLIQSPRFYAQALTTDVWSFCDPLARPMSNYWRPTFVGWNILNCAAFGVGSPKPWHAGNIALHAVCVFLTYRLALALRAGIVAALAIACIAAVHPTRVESVAWIGASTDLILGVWSLATLGLAVACLRASGTPARWALGAGVLACFALALGSKEAAVGLIPTVGVLSWHLVPRDRRTAPPERRWDRLRCAAPLPGAMLAVGAAWFVIRLQILGQFMMHNPTYTPGEVVLSVPSAAWWYLSQALWPVRISPVYLIEVAGPGSMTWAAFWKPVLALAALGLFAAWWWFKAPTATAPKSGSSPSGAGDSALSLWPGDARLCARVGFTLYVCLLAPAMNIAAYSPDQPVHDRYLYVPLIGLLIACVPALTLGLGSIRRPALARVVGVAVCAAMAASLGGMAVFSHRLTPLWKDNRTTWAWGLEHVPTSGMCLGVLAMCAYDDGDLDRAAELIDRADSGSRDPSNLNPLRAYLLLDQGRTEESALMFEKIIHVLKPRVAREGELTPYRSVLAVAYSRLGKLEEAERLLRHCLEISPDLSPLVVEKLSVVVYKQGRADEALAMLEHEAARVDGSWINGSQLVIYRLGSLYYQRGRFREARANLEKFLELTQSQEARAMRRYRAEAEKAVRDLTRRIEFMPPG